MWVQTTPWHKVVGKNSSNAICDAEIRALFGNKWWRKEFETGTLDQSAANQFHSDKPQKSHFENLLKLLFRINRTSDVDDDVEKKSRLRDFWSLAGFFFDIDRNFVATFLGNRGKSFFLFWFDGEKQSHVRSWCHKPIWEQFVNDLRGYFCRWVMEPRSRYGHCLGPDIPNKAFSYTQNFLLHKASFKYNLTVFYFKHTLLLKKMD